MEGANKGFFPSVKGGLFFALYIGGVSKGKKQTF
jgi:hypothetical protein